MYALSVKQPYAERIARGTKKIEYRTWKVSHRGPLLIVASKGTEDGYKGEPTGGAICLVDVVDIRGEEDDYKWILANPRRVVFVPIRGFAGLYTVPDETIQLASGDALTLPPPPAPKPRPKKAASKPKKREKAEDPFDYDPAIAGLTEGPKALALARKMSLPIYRFYPGEGWFIDSKLRVEHIDKMSASERKAGRFAVKLEL